MNLDKYILGKSIFIDSKEIFYSCDTTDQTIVEQVV